MATPAITQIVDPIGSQVITAARRLDDIILQGTDFETPTGTLEVVYEHNGTHLDVTKDITAQVVSWTDTTIQVTLPLTIGGNGWPPDDNIIRLKVTNSVSVLTSGEFSFNLITAAPVVSKITPSQGAEGIVVKYEGSQLGYAPGQAHMQFDAATIPTDFDAVFPYNWATADTPSIAEAEVAFPADVPIAAVWNSDTVYVKVALKVCSGNVRVQTADGEVSLL